MACKTLTLKQLAQYALDMQRSDDISYLLCSWSDMLDRIRQLLHLEPRDNANKLLVQHPINVLLAEKVRQLCGATSEVELARAFYAVRAIIDGEQPDG